MAYIGRQPTVGNFQICDAISVVNGQAAYTMQVGSVNVLPETANHMIVSLNGVIQKPNSSFTVSGSTITFSSNLATGDVIDFIQILGDVLDLGVPSDATVTESKIGSNAVTSAKMFSGFANGITMADQWRLTTAQTFGGTAATLDGSMEQIDTTGQGTIGSAMTQSSGVFTFPSTGIYLILVTIAFGSTSADSRYVEFKINFAQDGSNFTTVSRLNSSVKYISSTTYQNLVCQSYVDVTNASTARIKFSMESQNATIIAGSTSLNESNCISFIRLGDT